MGHGRLPLYALLAASAISVAGNTMALLAVPWFVLETTGSASQTGFTAVFFFLPVPVAGLFGGVIIDRLGYKRSSIGGDLVSGAAIVAIPILHTTVGIEYWQLLVLVLLGAAFDSPADTARFSLLPEVARAAELPLERVTGAEDAILRVARMTGAPLAGLLIAVLGAENVLWVDAATFAISAALVAVAVPSVSRAHHEGRTTGYVDELKDGLAFLAGDRLLLTMMVAVGLTNFLWLALTAVLPVYADEVFDSSLALGLIVGLSAVGGLVGSLAFSAFGNRLPRFLFFAGGFLVVGLSLWLFPLEPPLLLLLAGRFISGLASGPIGPVMGTTQLERVPEQMRGRVVGISIAVAWTGTPLGALAGAMLLDAVDLTPTLVVIAVAYTIVALSLFALPALREMSARPLSMSAEKGES